MVVVFHGAQHLSMRVSLVRLEAGQLEHARMMDGSKNSTPKWNTNKKTNDNWSNHQILSDSIWILENPAALPSGLWPCCWAKKTSTHRRNLSGRGGKKILGFSWMFWIANGARPILLGSIRCDVAHAIVQCQCSASAQCPLVRFRAPYVPDHQAEKQIMQRERNGAALEHFSTTSCFILNTLQYFNMAVEMDENGWTWMNVVRL